LELGRAERLCTVLAFLGALAVRIVPFADDVFHEGGVRPWRCPDVYYHLHRIAVAAREWPRFPELDHWRNYPDGAYSLWSPLFDFVPGTLAAWSGLPPLVVGVLWPALLGALAVFPLFDLLRRLHGRAAWAGVALYIVLPGAVSFAVVGRADHHVGEVLMQLWVYALTLRALIDIEAGAVPRPRSALALGATMGLSLWMWRGSVVFLAVPAAVLLFAVATTREAPLRRGVVRHVALVLLVAVASTLPYGVLNAARGRPPFSAYYLSLLQPAMLASWALLLPLAEQLGETRRQLRPLLRARVLLPLVGVAALAAFAIDGLLGGVAFLTRVGDPWAATITESQPLWAGGLPSRYAIEQLGFAPFLLLAIAFAQLIALLRRSAAPTALFVLLCTACATGLVFTQVRFVYYAAPVVAALPGGLWFALRESRPALRAAAVGLALALILPTGRFWSPVFDGNPRSQMRPLPMEAWLTRLLSELAAVTPPAGDGLRPDLRPAYCVLAPWDLGNFIQTVAQRPVLASSGGPHETAAYADTLLFLRHFTSESEAVALMRARGCRYAITDWPKAAARGNQRLFAQRLHGHDGSDTASQLGSGRFRFRFESLRAVGEAVSRYKVFELVAGAELRLPRGAATHVETTVNAAQRRLRYRRKLEPSGASEVATHVSQPGEYRVLDARGALLGKIAVPEQAIARGGALSFAARP
jgi:dolichyl-diphosphooligosaccharide--protein glycosyltransferase